jgi:3-dehydroquinate dehydratase
MFDEFVLAASTADLSVVDRAASHADAIEFRMDLAENPRAQLKGYDGSLPVIATNRADWEGGQADSLARYDELAAAVSTDAVTAVDIELAALRGTAPPPEAERARSLRDAAQKADVSVIASVHDFESTPAVAELTELLADAASAGDIAKLATTATSRDDALAILRATHTATLAGHSVATMGMGKVGRHTRAIAPLYGSRIGYAPVDPESATAPGQYPLRELAALVDSLESDSRPVSED